MRQLIADISKVSTKEFQLSDYKITDGLKLVEHLEAAIIKDSAERNALVKFESNVLCLIGTESQIKQTEKYTTSFLDEQYLTGE